MRLFSFCRYWFRCSASWSPNVRISTSPSNFPFCSSSFWMVSNWRLLCSTWCVILSFVDRMDSRSLRMSVRSSSSSALRFRTASWASRSRSLSCCSASSCSWTVCRTWAASSGAAVAADCSCGFSSVRLPRAAASSSCAFVRSACSCSSSSPMARHDACASASRPCRSRLCCRCDSASCCSLRHIVCSVLNLMVSLATSASAWSLARSISARACWICALMAATRPRDSASRLESSASSRSTSPLWRSSCSVLSLLCWMVVSSSSHS
mmetsp:Transcript_14524/g.51080  ORF Transcript_14524/g.51080 Transcript_14524/m.51080 type:complete len:266 (-) Transcript_14524:3354-4151(-)